MLHSRQSSVRETVDKARDISQQIMIQYLRLFETEIKSVQGFLKYNVMP